MAFDDLPLERHPTPEPGAPPPEVRRSSPWRLVLVGVAGIAAGVALTFWWLSRTQPDPASPPPTQATEVAVGSNRPKPQPIDLPPLSASDLLLRELVSSLSKHQLVARLLATPELVKGATLAVVQIGDGKTPAAPLVVARPLARLQLRGGLSSGPIEPASYARWDTAVSALISVNPRDAAQLYVTVKPLFDEAYREYGHQEDFDRALVRAYEMLAATPEVTTDPVLVSRPGYYEHEDPALRALRPVQKQFLLMGPASRAAVLRWFRDLATVLELDLK
jgi:hypothetical protein